MDKKKLRQIIEQAARDGKTSLNLSGNKLTELPFEIGQLTNLEALDLSENQLTELPMEIGQLTSLTKLDLNSNQISKFPSEVTQISTLEHLALNFNQLTAISPEINQMLNLTRLDLWDNPLKELPPEIGHLFNLKIIILYGNKLTTLPSEFGQLANLTTLNLIFNKLIELPPEVGQLSKLTEFKLSYNRLTKLPLEFRQLSNLKILDLSGNQLTSLSSGIGGLINLISLDMSKNKLIELPPEIGQLSDLIELKIKRNQLTTLPPELGRLSNLDFLDLRENNLPVPPEILMRVDEPAVIVNYYLQHQSGKKRPLNEAKTLLLGQGGVGKTSLVKRLVEGRFDRYEGKTKGIDIKPWQVTSNGQLIRLNIWDFGGQEIMHATHQFFLTRRSLYILVLDARLGEEENRLEYWLKLIQSFGADSPVIVVGNKIDQHPLDIDKRGLQSKYKTIKAFIETSCETGQGIDTLKAAIAKEVGKLEHIHDQLLDIWFAVKTQLEEMDQDYIPYSEYVRLCRAQGIADDLSQRTLIGFLHDLGIVLNFQDNPLLEETNILNPEWVTNGVYEILNSNELFQSKGVLEREQLKQILDSEKYPRHKHLFIMDMMRKFELCFDFEGFPNQKFLVPDLLAKEESYTGDWRDSLALQYHYNVLPSSIISRFIVRMHPYIHQNTCWRSGVVLAHKENKALIKADAVDKRIFIWVTGAEQTRRDFLSIIRFEFDSIHRTISKIEAREKVPLPEHPEIPPIDYQYLLDLEALGEQSFIPEGLRERVTVKYLLDGIEAEHKRKAKWGIAPPSNPVPPKKKLTVKRTNPWLSGSFYLVALIVILILITVISANIPWYVLPVVIIGGLFAIAVVGALQLRQDERLSQRNFLELMVETFKRLPLLKSITSTQDNISKE